MNVRYIVPLVSDISKCDTDYIAKIAGKYLDGKNNVTMYEEHERFWNPFFLQGSTLVDNYCSLCEFLVCFGFLSAHELSINLGNQLHSYCTIIARPPNFWLVSDANDVDYYFNFKGSTVDLSDQPKVLLHMATRLSRFINHLKKEELFGEDFGLKNIHISLVIMFLFGINHPDNMEGFVFMDFKAMINLLLDYTNPWEMDKMIKMFEDCGNYLAQDYSYLLETCPSDNEIIHYMLYEFDFDDDNKNIVSDTEPLFDSDSSEDEEDEKWTASV